MHITKYDEKESIEYERHTPFYSKFVKKILIKAWIKQISKTIYLKYNFCEGDWF